MHIRTLVFVGLAAAGLCAAGVFAQATTQAPDMGGPHGMHGRRGGLVKLLIHATDLTPDQEAKVQQILAANRPAMQDLHSQMRQARNALANLVLGPQDVPPDALSAQLSQIAQLKQQLAEHHAATIMSIRALLTPDQLAKAAAARDEWLQRRKDHCTANPT